MSSVTHLCFTKDVEFMAGKKAENSGDISKAKFIPGRTRGIILSYLLKEEPPDAPCITKSKSNQGL